jgi:hypothetical protein
MSPSGGIQQSVPAPPEWVVRLAMCGKVFLTPSCVFHY